MKRAKTHRAKPKNEKSRLSQSAGIVIIRGDRFLLLKKKFGGSWEFPKGRMEEGESIEETARREVREESGLRNVRLVSDWQQTIRFEFHFQHRIVRRRVTFFLGRGIGRIKLSSAHKEYRWVSASEALGLLRYRNYHRLIHEAQSHLPKQAKTHLMVPVRKRRRLHSQTN